MIRVVKCGGQVLDDDALLAAFCRDFAALEGPKVLVHGGGALAGRFQKALGIEPVKYEGPPAVSRRPSASSRSSMKAGG